MDWDRMRQNLLSCEQEHLLKWLDDLSVNQQSSLYSELNAIDFKRLHRCFAEAQQSLLDSAEKKDDRLLPLDESICASTVRNSDQVDSWQRKGLELISNGKVGVLLLAGGQGTRLGVSYPKGMYNVGLPSNKTLYQLQAERIIRLQRLAKEQFGNEPIITWYIMTSEYTRDTTITFFTEHKYFGLDPRNVVIFEQNTLPCVTFEGKVILDQKYRIARAPDGNGGLYSALVNPDNDILQNMKSRGIECVHVYGVDNILVKMADPVFVGYCSLRGADCGAKVVKKSLPTEKVGVVCLLDGKYQVVEYSEISTHTAERLNPDGTLTFNAGSICNHFFTVSFLERICTQHKDSLVHHVAKKKIPFINEKGERIEPDTPNGIKMEKFVFDVFQFSECFAVLEVARDEEFAPLKNGPGAPTDSPSTIRHALMNLHCRQVLKAGGSIVNDSGTTVTVNHTNGPVRIVCEISPLVSYSGEGLHNLCSGIVFKEPVHLETDEID